MRMGVFGLSIEPASGAGAFWRADLFFWAHGAGSPGHRIGTYEAGEAETLAVDDVRQYIADAQWRLRGVWLTVTP